MNRATYNRAKAAGDRFYEHYQHSMTMRPRLPAHQQSMDYIIDQLAVAMATELAAYPVPKVSNRALGAFRRLVEGLGDGHAADINLVYLELIGRAPREPDALIDALTELLGADRAAQVEGLLRTHQWGPPKRRGRRKSTPIKFAHCALHGSYVEFRQYANGRLLPDGSKQMVWRCMMCRADAERRRSGE